MTDQKRRHTKGRLWQWRRAKAVGNHASLENSLWKRNIGTRVRWNWLGWGCLWNHPISI